MLTPVQLYSILKGYQFDCTSCAFGHQCDSRGKNEIQNLYKRWRAGNKGPKKELNNRKVTRLLFKAAVV